MTERLGIEIPIIQAPMGFIARAQLPSAVSNAGGMGIVETSSARLDEVLPVRQILDETWRDSRARLRELGTWAED